MAKSIRSKHRRRMRNVKREKFAKKDLAKLKATVMKDVLNNKDEEMAEIVTIKKVSDLKEQVPSTSAQAGEMDVDKGSTKVYDKIKMTDEHGQYPAWMNQRAIRKLRFNLRFKNKKVKRGKGKKASA